MAEETSPDVVDVPEVEPVQLVDDDGNAIEAEVMLDEDGNPVEPEPEAAEEDDDTDEIEKDGEKYRIPKALKDNFLMHKDYTHKTQALAEKERQVDAGLQNVETALQQAKTVSEAEVHARAEVIAIDQQIAAYEQIDWDHWENLDAANGTNEAAKEWRRFERLKATRQAAVEKHNQAFQQRIVAEKQVIQHRTSLEQQETAKRREQGRAIIAQHIPDWNEEKGTALLNFGRTHYGFSKEELDNIDDPRIVLALNDAFQHTQAATKTKTVAKVQAQQAVRPAGKVMGVAAPIRPLDDRASTDAWMKARMKQKQASTQ